MDGGSHSRFSKKWCCSSPAGKGKEATSGSVSGDAGDGPVIDQLVESCVGVEQTKPEGVRNYIEITHENNFFVKHIKKR